MIDHARCMASKDNVLGGERCQKDAPWWTLFGSRCNEHAEELRKSLRDPNTVLNIVRGRLATEEEIARAIVKKP